MFGLCKSENYSFLRIVSALGSLLSSPSFRSIIPLWHAKEAFSDHFQINGVITGWELHIKSREGFVLSDEYSKTGASNEIDLTEYSLGERITTSARKVGLEHVEKVSLLLKSSN